MKQLIITLLILSVFVACKKDPQPPPDTNGTSSLELKLNAWFDDEAFVAGETYHNISDYRVNVTELKLYLSDVYAVKNNGDTVFLSDIALFHLNSGEDAITVEDVPAGEYVAFGFGLGVSTDLNSPQNEEIFDISLFDNDHPLSISSGMYWTWQAGYRFVIFEGKYNTDSDGTDPLIEGYSYHTGKDESYRTVEFDNINFEVNGTGNSVINLDFDVDRFYYSQSDTVDVAVDSQTHGTNQDLSNRVSENITEAISFRE